MHPLTGFGFDSDDAVKRANRSWYKPWRSASSGPSTHIYFYDKTSPHYAFANSSPFPVEHKSESFPTAEHLFHALKFLPHRPDIATYISSLASPDRAYAAAQHYVSQVKPSWRYGENKRAMEYVLYAKFTQHTSLRQELLDTGERKLVFESPLDEYWGVGESRNGKNKLGRILMRLRRRFLQEQQSTAGPSGITKTLSQLKSRLASSQPRDIPPPTKHQIIFNDEDGPYHSFSNSSPYPIIYNNLVYPTSEHLFQAMKFFQSRPEVAEYIRTFSHDAVDARRIAHNFRVNVSPSWYDGGDIKSMDEVLYAKFFQYPTLVEELLSTSDCELVYNTPDDSFWGVLDDGMGQNQLGKALERLRTRINEEDRMIDDDEDKQSQHLHGVSYYIDHLSAGRAHPKNHPSPPKPKRILFYDKDDPYFEFTNFARYPVVWQGKRYPTSEHLFQAMKFYPDWPDIQENVRRCATPADAFKIGRQFQDRVPLEWKKGLNLRAMDEVLYLKFTQHPELTEKLLATEDAELIENSPTDSYWGIGKNADGQNQLGKALERLRARLRREEELQEEEPRGPRHVVRRIFFHYKTDAYFFLSNTSPHPIVYQGRRYPTGEHLYQSFKFLPHRPDIAEYIRVCSERPSVAFKEAQKFKSDIRKDWFQINTKMMDETLRLKFSQHADLGEALLATDDAELIENSFEDSFWGIGPHGTGRNKFGRALMKLRDELAAGGAKAGA